MTDMDVAVSADGTAISFRSTGQGPGLVVVPGNNRRAHHYERFMQALPRYRVHALDRRGRGASGPQGPAYSIEREVDDVLAVAAATGSELLFGHSYGGLIALHTVLRRPFSKLAAYDPGVSLDGSFDLTWLPDFARLLAAGRPHAAMATFTKRTGLVPIPPAPLAVHYGLAYLLLRGKDGADTLAMMPTTPGEIGEIARLDSDGSRYAAITTPTLLLTGTKVPAYIREVAPRLAAIMPDARCSVLPDADHNAPDLNRPSLVAAHVDAFLTARS
ncbi:alpha/beta fold hydrolase [Dactylosporangium sp. CS-047395]|uniref:alpha/beta fold hydrolase n=1 Tax=Dactylosporangium sp. CS-047395 TaxID=3239936 RepID=UPI003D8D324F